MKKIILFFSLIIIVYNVQIFAQWGSYEHAIGGSAVLSIPVGDFSDAAGIGYGIKAKYIFMFSSNVGWFTEAGYLNWTEKETFGYKFKSSSFLINSGLKINLIPHRVGPYFLAGAGVHFWNSEGSYSFSSQYFGFQSYSFSDSQEYFNILGGLGYEFELGFNTYFDINANYNYLFDAETSYIGVNAGVNFGLY